MPSVPDTITITCTRPATGRTGTVVIPPQIVQLLDYLAENTQDPNSGSQPTQRYSSTFNVIWKDILQYLVPDWQRRYVDMVTSDQIKQLKDQVQTQINSAVSQIEVTES